MTDHVLDASAVLADIFDEPGAEVVRATGSGSRLSTVNYAEVVSKLIDKGFDAEEARGIAGLLPFDIIELDRNCAANAGVLRATTRRVGLSLGDRVCLALAAELQLPVLTADRRWADLDLGVEVRLIR
jgi:PIN domain nuclease of toxin-antitoxin system